MGRGSLIAIIVVVIVVIAGASAYVLTFKPSSKPTIIFSGWVSSGEEYTFDLQMVKSFNALHPNMTVKFSPITSNYYATLESKFETNTAPAVFYMENDALPQFAKDGYLLNLTPYLSSNASYDLSGFVPSIIHTFYWNGGLYAAPKDWNPLFVYFNKYMFNVEHVPYPSNYSVWNWSTMLNTLELLKQNLTMLPNGGSGYYPMVVGPQFARILAFMHEAEGQWINRAGDGVSRNISGLLPAIKFWYGLYSRGLAALNSNLSAGWNGGDFSLGHVGMIVSGGWTVPVLYSNGSWFKNNPQYIGYYHMPMDVQYATMGFDVGLAVNSKLTGADRYLALQFVEYFTGPQGEASWVKLGLALPARTAILDSSTYAQEQPILAYAGSSQASYTYGWAYNTTNFTAVESGAHKIIANLFAGLITPTEAYYEIINETNQGLAGSSTL